MNKTTLLKTAGTLFCIAFWGALLLCGALAFREVFAG